MYWCGNSRILILYLSSNQFWQIQSLKNGHLHFDIFGRRDIFIFETFCYFHRIELSKNLNFECLKLSKLTLLRHSRFAKIDFTEKSGSKILRFSHWFGQKFHVIINTITQCLFSRKFLIFPYFANGLHCPLISQKIFFKLL